MNLLDYVIIAAVAAAAIFGLSRGALRMVTSAVSLTAGIYLAWLYYPRAAAVVHEQFGGGLMLDAVAGYLIVFAIVFAAVEFAGQSASRLVRAVHLNWADRLFGGALGVLVAGVAVGLGVTMLTATLPGDTKVLRDSQLAPALLAYNRALVAYIPEEVRSAYELRRAELLRYWTAGRAQISGKLALPESSAAPAERR